MLRKILLALIGALYVLSIPWYRSAGATPEIWFGLPDWVALAIACYAGVALLNCVAWLRTDVSDELPPAQAEAGRERERA